MAFLFLIFERLIILLFYGKMLAKQIVICRAVYKLLFLSYKKYKKFDKLYKKYCAEKQYMV